MSEQFDEYQVEQFEQAAYQGAMLEASKEWERQREEFDLHEAEWQARAEKAEAMVERMIANINELGGAIVWSGWQDLVDEWQATKKAEE